MLSKYVFICEIVNFMKIFLKYKAAYLYTNFSFKSFMIPWREREVSINFKYKYKDIYT